MKTTHIYFYPKLCHFTISILSIRMLHRRNYDGSAQLFLYSAQVKLPFQWNNTYQQEGLCCSVTSYSSRKRNQWSLPMSSKSEWRMQRERTNVANSNNHSVDSHRMNSIGLFAFHILANHRYRYGTNILLHAKVIWMCCKTNISIHFNSRTARFFKCFFIRDATELRVSD